MRWTGNVARTFGQILLVVGLLAFVLGLVGLIFGGLLVKDAADDPSQQTSDVGDVVEVFVVGGLSIIVGGIVGVVLGLVLLGVARSLRERLARKQSATPSAGQA